MLNSLKCLLRLYVNHGRDPEYLQWHRQHRSALKRFENAHRGEKCFIIGNGPSLNRMNLSPLRDCVCFGLNKVHLLLEQNDFSIDYHVATNPLVIEQSIQEFAKFDCPSFLSFHATKGLRVASNRFYYLLTKEQPFVFGTDIQNPVFEGFTVTYVAMQLAYYMGFSTVYLIGVDHQFVAQGDPHEKQLLVGPHPNHFHPDYFGNKECNLPDLPGSELAYRLAKFHFEAAGRNIFDATVGGKLEVFPKMEFERAVAEYKSARIG